MTLNHSTRHAISLALLVSFICIWLSPAYTPAARATFPVVTGAKSSALSGCGGTLLAPQDIATETEIIHMVNQERSARNLPPLKVADALANSARYHAADLGEDDYFNHDSYDRASGELVYTCNTWERIASFYEGGQGENIGAGYTSPTTVMEAWMNSAGHRANILSTTHWEIGVGYWQGLGTYDRYYVQNFGRRAGVFPLVINLDAPTTGQRDVQLFIYGNWTEMRLRNNDQPWSEWQPFQAHVSWQLPNELGIHAVSVELHSDSLSAVSSDQIELVTVESTALLANLPDTITFLYSQSTQAWLSPLVTLTPLNATSPDPIPWQVSTDASWIDITPLTGITPDGFTLSPDLDPAALAVPISATVTVASLLPIEVEGSPHRITVTVQLSSAEFFSIYLPNVQR